MREEDQPLYAVIPAGGSGTRLWPLSRAANPKFLLALTGSDGSLLQATARRLAPLAPPERTFVVTGAAHAAVVARQLAHLPAENILVEPSPKDTCAAIALAAALIEEQDPGAVMASFAVDHLIRDHQRFGQAVRDAIHGAQAGYLMTIGIRPDRPSTAFGYLACGEPVSGLPILSVREFTEKPTSERAARYLASGGYLWNASIFVFRTTDLLAELARRQPRMHESIREIAAAWRSDNRDKVLGSRWPELPRTAIDYALMEEAAAAGRVATVPAEFDWTDVGDFNTIGDVLPKDGNGTVLVAPSRDAPVILHDAHRLVVVATGSRMVAALGVDDLVLVDTPDVLLVCARDRAQDIKRIVDQMRTDGLDSYL